MTEVIPQADRVNSGQRKLARGAVRTTPRVTRQVAVADGAAVDKVLKLLVDGQSLVEACNKAQVTPQAFWRRVLADPSCKRDAANTIMTKAFSRTDRASASGTNGSALAAFAKIGREMAAALDPAVWGDKVQVESRSLVINCNLDFGAVCESLEGIVQDTPDVSIFDAHARGREAERPKSGEEAVAGLILDNADMPESLEISARPHRQ